MPKAKPYTHSRTLSDQLSHATMVQSGKRFMVIFFTNECLNRFI